VREGDVRAQRIAELRGAFELDAIDARLAGVGQRPDKGDWRPFDHHRSRNLDIGIIGVEKGGIRRHAPVQERRLCAHFIGIDELRPESLPDVGVAEIAARVEAAALETARVGAIEIDFLHGLPRQDRARREGRVGARAVEGGNDLYAVYHHGQGDAGAGSAEIGRAVAKEKFPLHVRRALVPGIASAEREAEAVRHVPGRFTEDGPGLCVDIPHGELRHDLEHAVERRQRIGVEIIDARDQREAVAFIKELKLLAELPVGIDDRDVERIEGRRIDIDRRAGVVLAIGRDRADPPVGRDRPVHGHLAAPCFDVIFGIGSAPRDARRRVIFALQQLGLRETG